MESDFMNNQDSPNGGSYRAAQGNLNAVISNPSVNINDTILTLYTNKDVPLFDKNKLFKISDNINNDNSSLIYEIIK